LIEVAPAAPLAQASGRALPESPAYLTFITEPEFGRGNSLH
jgi:hypothetical protein